MIYFSSTTILPLAPKIPIKKTKQNILQRCGIMVPTEQGESTQEIIFVSTRLLRVLKWSFKEPCFKIMSLIVIVPFEICLLGKKVLKIEVGTSVSYLCLERNPHKITQVPIKGDGIVIMF